MKFGSLAWAVPLLVTQVSGEPTYEQTAIDDLAAQAKAEAYKRVNAQATQLQARGLTPTCTPDKLVFRKE